MDLSAIFAKILESGGVWGALLLLSGAANVYLFKSHTQLYEKMLEERGSEVREMTTALQQVSATQIAMTSSIQEIMRVMEATKNAMEEISRTIALGFETTRMAVAQNKEAIERFERLPTRGAAK